MTGTKILIVEDEAPIREMIAFHLARAGYETLEAADCRSARRLLADERPDLALVDWMLPDMSGLELTRMLKRDNENEDLAVIMLTARSDEHDKVSGLEGGADDYITKPFSPRELVLRVKAVLRRAGGEDYQPQVIRAADLEIDLAGHRVARGGEAVSLSRMEFNLLTALARQPGQTFTRDQLLDHLHGYSGAGYDRSIDAHVKNLRRKLEPDPGNPVYILTVYGIGYQFADEA
jgi:DNA-binding response OmpR family regulator